MADNPLAGTLGFMTKRVGALPVGIYVLGGGVVGGLYLRNRKKKTAAASAVTAATTAAAQATATAPDGSTQADPYGTGNLLGFDASGNPVYSPLANYSTPLGTSYAPPGYQDYYNPITGQTFDPISSQYGVPLDASQQPPPAATAPVVPTGPTSLPDTGPTTASGATVAALNSLGNVGGLGYPQTLPAGSNWTQLGTVTASGYQGKNVAGGAPVYFQTPGSTTYAQGLNLATAPVGTKVYVPTQFAGAVY